MEAKKRPHGAQEYQGNGKHLWEHVADGTERLRVPGGWIYAVETGGGRENSAVFVPVPQTVGYVI